MDTHDYARLCRLIFSGLQRSYASQNLQLFIRAYGSTVMSSMPWIRKPQHAQRMRFMANQYSRAIRILLGIGYRHEAVVLMNGKLIDNGNL
jgi:hypothetical protein